MKRTNKLNKRNHNTIASAEINTNAAHAEVSFIMIAKGVLGFRESAHLVKIAEETDCSISIASGKKFGSSKGILSLVNLGITAGKSLVLNIKGDRNEDAFREVSKIINGETDSNS